MTTNQAVKYPAYIKSTHELGLWARIARLVRHFINTHISMGYQDEKGFHFGMDRGE